MEECGFFYEHYLLVLTMFQQVPKGISLLLSSYSDYSSTGLGIKVVLLLQSHVKTYATGLFISLIADETTLHKIGTKAAMLRLLV